MLRILSVVAVVGLLAGPVRGQEAPTYTIKIKKNSAGKNELADNSMEMVKKLKVTDLNGDVLKEQEEKEGERVVFRETVLERGPDKKATRLQRRYEKARGTAKGQTKTFPYEGKTVLIEKKGDRYAFRIEGGEELTGADAKQLEKEFNGKRDAFGSEFEKLVLPKRPVKLGETWKFDPDPLRKAFTQDDGSKFDPAKAKAVGKLTRVYRKGGHQFGVIDVRVELVPLSLASGGKTIPLESNSRVRMHLTLDACIDGTLATAAGRVDMDFHVEALLPSADQAAARMILSVTMKMNIKQVEQ